MNDPTLRLNEHRLGTGVGIITDGSAEGIDSAITLIQAELEIIHSFFPPTDRNESVAKHIIWDFDKPGVKIDACFRQYVPYYCAVKSPFRKKRILDAIESTDILFGSVAYHPTTRRAVEVLMGLGSIVDGYCWISHDVQIKKFVNIGSHVHVSSEVRIGECVTIGPNATLLPYCEIGDVVEIGAGSVIWPKVRIGDGAYIRPGSVVKENVMKNEVY